MSKIRVLSPDVASQIAAGEVVERPSSAVKELLENSLDAEATRCTIEIEGGGVTRLCVIDDGIGMTRDDAVLALERHATSKLSTVHDLGRITTFGFRGEALPSLASVSRFLMRTRTRAENEGTEVTVDAGAPATRPAGSPPGTTVEVRDLFYNVPARRKFLRSAATESGHVTAVVEALALARPEVSFTLTRDGRVVREWLRAGGREERVKRALDDDSLARATGERGPLLVEAYLSRPERARTNATSLRLLVNGRAVRDRAIVHTVAQAYGSVLERGRYPSGVVYLDLPPELIDVNVHPRKAEVRFADARAVSDAVYSVLSSALASAFSLPTPPRSQWAAHARSLPAERQDAAEGPQAAHSIGSSGDVPSSGRSPEAYPVGPPVHEVRDSAARGDLRTSVPWSGLTFVAQLRHTYLLCEGREGIYLLDQHAAAERVTFDKLRKQYLSRAVPSQSLLFPIMLDVSARDIAMVEEHGSDFSAVGFEVRVRGSEALSLHSVPRLLQRADPERLLRDLLAEVARTGGRAFSDAVDLALATMACHGSIRAGDPLRADEAAALLESLDRADFAGHCPHGRPVVTFTSWAELERQVGRR